MENVIISDNIIVSNTIKCKSCNDIIYSAHRHDFKTCNCKAVSVDGGVDYLKRVGDIGNIEELSIIMNKEIIDNCIKAVDWSKETGRNSRGTVYAVLRVLRDHKLITY